MIDKKNKADKKEKQQKEQINDKYYYQDDKDDEKRMKRMVRMIGSILMQLGQSMGSNGPQRKASRRQKQETGNKDKQKEAT